MNKVFKKLRGKAHTLRRLMDYGCYEVIGDILLGRAYEALPYVKGISPQFKYALISVHGTGLGSLRYYTSLIGARPTPVMLYRYGYPRYFYKGYDTLVVESDIFEDEWVEAKKAQKLISFQREQIPALLLVRDPISIMKSLINCCSILQNALNRCDKNLKSKKQMVEDIIKKRGNGCYNFTTICNNLDFISHEKMLLIQTSEITGLETTYKTMEEVARFFNLPSAIKGLSPASFESFNSADARIYPATIKIDDIIYYVGPKERLYDHTYHTNETLLAGEPELFNYLSLSRRRVGRLENTQDDKVREGAKIACGGGAA